MIITLAILCVLLMVFAAGRINLYLRFKQEVEELFFHAKKVPEKVFRDSQLAGLPLPVRRYFRLVLKEGQPYISYARLTHGGQFKTGQGKSWVNIQGEQYFTIGSPGFIWKGATNMFTARDMYIAGAGRLVVTLFSLYNIVDAKGEKYNQGELLRWLAENVWFPTALLPGEQVKWSAIDMQTAKLTFSYNGLEIYYTVTFNEAGEIARLETKRYMGDGKLETWVGKLNNYKEMNGILIPTSIEVAWELAQGSFSYAKFTVKNIEYDNPGMF